MACCVRFHCSDNHFAPSIYTNTMTQQNGRRDADFASLYTLGRRLQSGSYGTVYVAKNKQTDERVAVKMIDRNKIKKEKKKRTERAIQREVYIMKELQGKSDGVIQLIDFYEYPDTYHLVMELAAGGDLFDKLRQFQTYTEQDARDLAFQLFDTIAFLHSRNIVHRDLKPENLLLLKKGDTQLKLGDFGFARKMGPNGFMSTRCGTPSYIAPEILIGDQYGKSVDVWSMGVVLYMLIAGYPPFQGSNHRELFRKIRSADFSFRSKDWDHVSIQVKQLITGLLTVNTRYRLTAEQAMDSQWIQHSQEIHLGRHDLKKSLRNLEIFCAKEKLKGAVHATKWAMGAKFWNPDKITFTTQLHKWDALFQQNRESDETAILGSSVPLKKIKFKDVYKLGRRIQKGSMATVHECTCRKDHTVYAVKVIHRKGLSPMDDEDVLNEVAVLQSLKHDNIVQLVDFYEEDDDFYVVMEYMRGGDVFDRIVKRKSYTEKDARDLTRTLLKTVQFMHSQGVAHRDLKPQNLLLKCPDDDADIKVADFGFAKRVHTPQSLITRCGTPMYVAPEILKNMPHDQAVDMWSVGAIVYVIMVGYPPFGGKSRRELFESIRQGEYNFHEEHWSHVSEEAKSLIKGLLVVNPIERLTAEQALQTEWIMGDDYELSHRALHLDSIRANSSKWGKVRRAMKIMSAIKGSASSPTSPIQLPDDKDSPPREDEVVFEEGAAEIIKCQC